MFANESTGMTTGGLRAVTFWVSAWWITSVVGLACLQGQSLLASLLCR